MTEALAAVIRSVTDLWDEPLDEVHDVPQIVNAVLAARWQPAAQEGDREAWEREVLYGFLVAMPPTGEAVDYIAALTGVMLHARAAQEGHQGEAVAFGEQVLAALNNVEPSAYGDRTKDACIQAVEHVLAAVPDAGDVEHVLAAVPDAGDAVREAQADALQDAADAWSQGQWADAPRRADPAHERIANAQYVTDWLRSRERILREAKT